MMSTLFDQAQKRTNQTVRGRATYERGTQRGNAHLLIVALDYIGTPQQCQSTTNAHNMEHLAELCGVSCVSLYNDGCKKRLVCEAIQSSGGKCGPQDTLVIYYAGYARQLEDDNGDEVDGFDEALVLYDEKGKLSEDGLLRDDDFGRTVADSCTPEANVLIIADCNNSGSIADLNSAIWRDRRAISISACRDSQNVAEAALGGGGIFTHSMLLAIDRLGRLSETEYSVGLLFNAALKEDFEVFDSKQDFTIQALDNCQPDSMLWPLIPPAGYDSPLREAANKAEGGRGTSRKDVMTRDAAAVDETPLADAEQTHPSTFFGRWALFCGVELPSQTTAAVLATAMITTGVVSADVLQDANLQMVLAAIDPSYLTVVQGMDMMYKSTRYCEVCSTM